ncbi:MAG: DUF1802 family protein [Cyanothece sp. SIO1E1]|nr:DUF1802 family protein [Cyanothece sp. SIO1E1]
MEPMIHALKEWSVAVDALVAGDMIMLLRKGGIRDQGKSFAVTHDRAILYPTYEHQRPELLKPAYASQVQPVASGWHPHQVPIQAWAQITHVFQVSQADVVAALQPHHIWNQQFVTERLQWQPNRPVSVLLLRTYQLAEPLMIPYCSKYGGCRSWIDLAEPISMMGALPVLSEMDYSQQVEAIGQLIDG